MILSELIEELETALNLKGDVEVNISFQKCPGPHGLSELVSGTILDIIYVDNPENKNVGIWIQENAK